MSKLLSFFKNLFSSPVKRMPTDRLFSDWDLWEYDKLRDHFELEKIAKENAAKNSPNSEATNPDSFENSLLVRYNKIVSTKTIEIISQIELLEEKSAKALQTVQFLDQIPEQYRNSVAQSLNTLRPTLNDAKSKATSRKKELEDFKIFNNLSRDANYEDSSIWYFFILLVLIVVESLINNQMFQKGAITGFFGGFGIAFFISLINVFGAFLVGAFWAKLSWSIHQIPKYFGYLGFGVWGMFTIYFNLFVGHTRSLFETGYQGELSEAGSAGLQNVLNSPFALTDFYSWLLIIIGIIFAILALFDGIRFDDVYPGYGRVHRKYLDGEQEFQDEKTNIEMTADNIRKGFIAKGDDSISDLGETARDLRTKYSYVVSLINPQYPNYCRYYADLFTRLIDDYRNINRENRSDNAPNYFNQPQEMIWEEDNRDEQLSKLDVEINQIQTELSAKSEMWAEQRIALNNERIEATDYLND